jgi:hypothetical protein
MGAVPVSDLREARMTRTFCDRCGKEFEYGEGTDDTITLHIKGASLLSSLKGLSTMDDIQLHGQCFLAMGLLPFDHLNREGAA